MRLKVKNNYKETDKYDCEGGVCDGCGLKFICYTSRNEVTVEWDNFCNVLKGKKKPKLIFRGIL